MSRTPDRTVTQIVSATCRLLTGTVDKDGGVAVDSTNLIRSCLDLLRVADVSLKEERLRHALWCRSIRGWRHVEDCDLGALLVDENLDDGFTDARGASSDNDAVFAPVGLVREVMAVVAHEARQEAVAILKDGEPERAPDPSIDVAARGRKEAAHVRIAWRHRVGGWHC